MSNVKLRKVGRLTEAQVAIQNMSNERLHLEYRVEWENVNGFIVDQSGGMATINTISNTDRYIFNRRKNPEAEKIIVNLRKSDDPFQFEGVDGHDDYEQQ